jgi:sialic acid synthase SpsE
MEFMKGLIHDAQLAGFNAIKFQVLINPNALISSKHSKYDVLSTFCFSKNEWLDLFAYAGSKGLDIIYMPLDHEALKLVEFASVKYIDIHSISFNDNEFLSSVAQLKKPIILGVGGRSIEEIKGLISHFSPYVKVLMVGFQSYPSNINDIKIERISYLKEEFQEVKIGYADHSYYESEYSYLSNYIARFLGATFFEI